MNKSIKRLHALRGKLRRQAELVFERARSDLAATRAAQEDVLAYTIDAEMPASELQHRERLCLQLESMAQTLQQRQIIAQEAFAQATREHKQTEKIVATRGAEDQVKERRAEQQVVEVWLRHQRSRNRS